MSQFRVSWTMIQQFEKCKQRAMLIREGKSQPGNIRIYFPGTVVDRIMRQWLDDPQPGTMPDMVRAVMAREEEKAAETGDGYVKWKSRADKAEVEQLCVEAVTLLEPILKRVVLPHEYKTASRFRVPIRIPGLDGQPVEIILNGETDLVVRDAKGEWGIWDLKTTKNNSYWRKTMAQMTFYDLAHRVEHGSYPYLVGLLQPLCKEPIKAWQVTDDDRRQMFQRIERYAHSVWRKEFEPEEELKNCSMCPVKPHCAVWKPVNPGKANALGSVRVF